MRRERGQATAEWAGILLLVSLALGALVSVGLRVDGRSFGGFLAHRIACAVKGSCRDGDRALARAYGKRDAALVREHAPNLVYEPGERLLPVDYRRCRRPDCAEAPDDRDLDAHRSDDGERATVFTRVIRRDGRAYIQYWLYYPPKAERPAKSGFTNLSEGVFANGLLTLGSLREVLPQRRAAVDKHGLHHLGDRVLVVEAVFRGVEILVAKLMGVVVVLQQDRPAVLIEEGRLDAHSTARSGHRVSSSRGFAEVVV
jgi:hypothetical protein